MRRLWSPPLVSPGPRVKGTGQVLVGARSWARPFERSREKEDPSTGFKTLDFSWLEGEGGGGPPIPFIQSSPCEGKRNQKWNSRIPPSPNSIFKEVGIGMALTHFVTLAVLPLPSPLAQQVGPRVSQNMVL